jgi:hypothetical protein
MPAANSRYDVCPPAPSSVSSYSSGISPPPSYRNQEGSILSISSSLPSYHSLPPAGHTSGSIVVAPPLFISPPPSYTSQVGSVTPSIISQASISPPPSYASQIRSVTPSFSSLSSYYPQPPMAYSANGNFQPNLGMVPEMGMYYGVQSAPMPTSQIQQYYSIPSFQQVVNYSMQQNYQPPIPMQMYQPPVMPPVAQVPGGYTIVDTTDANWVYSDSSSSPTGTRIRISGCCIQ